MNIIMEYGGDPTQLSQDTWEYAFMGHDIDDRGHMAADFIQSKSNVLKKIVYSSLDTKINVGNDEIWADDIQLYLVNMGINSSSHVVIESTSIGFAELLLLIQSLNDIGCKAFDVLYLEPMNYAKRSIEFVERHSFNLSTEVEGFKAIPGHALAFDYRDKVAVLCGYESDRLGRAFEELDLLGKNCQLFFGMPPYTVGWDKNTYANYLPLIENHNISKEFYYTGASNPLAVYEHLEKIYLGLDHNQKLFIMPMGPKPMSLGACIFKVSKNVDNLSIIYDHPVKKKNRSTQISHWNLYRVQL